MAYPWPSFGTFQFRSTERPDSDSDSGWQPSISKSQNRALGALTDTVVTTALGSLTRVFSVYMTDTRIAELQALLGTSGAFCDWTRPTPASRSAYLSEVNADDAIIRVGNRQGETTDYRRHVRVSLISQ